MYVSARTGLNTRIPGTHRYRPTHDGLRTALFCSRLYAHFLRPGLAQLLVPDPSDDSLLRTAFDRLETATDHFLERAFAAA